MNRLKVRTGASGAWESVRPTTGQGPQLLFADPDLYTQGSITLLSWSSVNWASPTYVASAPVLSPNHPATMPAKWGLHVKIAQLDFILFLSWLSTIFIKWS